VELRRQIKSDALPAPTWADLEKMPEVLMAEPSIDITAKGTAQTMMLHFRARPAVPDGTDTTIPRIRKITIGNPEQLRHRGTPECLVRGEEPVSMKVWHYGDTPAGFEKFGCDKLAPGEYAISVQFLGGYGGLRIVVDEKGSVTPRPLEGSTTPLWDGN
jgi:hypothetical protein